MPTVFSCANVCVISYHSSPVCSGIVSAMSCVTYLVFARTPFPTGPPAVIYSQLANSKYSQSSGAV